MKRFFTLQVLIYLTFFSLKAQFSASTILENNLSLAIRNIIVFDVDNDNLNDIVVSYYLNDVYWYKNNGDGFDLPQNISSSVPAPYHIDVADVNGDGFQDLLVTNNNDANSGAVLFINNNGGQFWTEVLIDSSIPIAFKSFFLDVENDGDADIVINGDSEINLYLNDGTGSFSSAVLIESMNEYYSISVNDFTNDNFTDLVLNTGTSGTVLFVNDTNGSFNAPITIATGLTIFLCSEDIDKDGDFEIFRGNPNNTSEIQLYINNGNSFDFSHNESHADAQDATNSKFQLVDLGMDEYKDILLIHDDQIFWKENLQNGTFSTPMLIDDSRDYRLIRGGDIDSDGDQDIIWFALDPTGSHFKLGYMTNDMTSEISELSTGNHVKLFPNPTNNTLNISKFETLAHVKLFNLYGQKVTNIYKSTIDVSGLNEGVYYIQFQDQFQQKSMLKLIIK